MTTITTYVVYILGAIIAYEIVRALLLTWLRKKLYGSVREYLSSNEIRLDRYKFMHKIAVKEELMNDPEIHEAIIVHSRENNLLIKEVQDRVAEYIEEIVPFFNLLSYYKIGYWVSNTILNLIYEVVIDHENAAKLEKIPRDSVVVFIMNHRSNIDYILVAYMLARQISLSFAVGEWARVWPLEYIFKSFGAYFIRRKFREKLYHLVLQKYVQLISLQGVTQGIFIEGGLSRDGTIRPAKIGILDYIIAIKKNPDFKKDLVFVPAAINYDHVLEDSTLVAEWEKGRERSGFRDNIASLLKILVKGPIITVMNAARYITGRLKRHGYASVSFGDPVFLDDFLKQQKVDIFKLERKDRLARIQKFADSVLSQIALAIPVTPVCITAYALLSLKNGPVEKIALSKRVEVLRRRIKGNGGRIISGRAFEVDIAIQKKLKNEKDHRRKDLLAFEEDMIESDESRQTVKIALDIMKRRKMIVIKQGKISILDGKKSLLEYYAKSLDAITHA